MQNTERMLHFDVSQGCTAETLIEALAALCNDAELVNRSLQSCGIDPAQRTTLPATSSKSHRPHKPAWARSPKKVAEQKPEDAGDLSEYSAWLRGEKGTLIDVEKQLEERQQNPIAFAIASKVIATLKSTLGKCTGLPAESTFLEGTDCARIFARAVAFSELIADLSPAAITASRVAMSTSNDVDIFKSGWILTLAEDIPTIDRLWPAPYSDYLGLAFLRAVVSRFGARGESVIAQHGTGQTPQEVSPRVTTRAILCSPPRVSSTVTVDASHPPLPLIEITATLSQGLNFSDLLRRLQSMGLKSVMTWQAFEASSYPRMMLRALVSNEVLDKVLEILLVTGEASEIATTNVESQSLQQRVVSVPYGHRQKMQGCRVNEWLWSGKVIRVDPDASDLAQIVQATGFAQEVVRADVLAAWRKWRQAETCKDPA